MAERKPTEGAPDISLEGALHTLRVLAEPNRAIGYRPSDSLDVIVSELERLAAQVAAVRALHKADDGLDVNGRPVEVCWHDGLRWPCPTSKVLDGPVSPLPAARPADECCDCICGHQCTKDPTVIGHQGCIACKWCSCTADHAARPADEDTRARDQRVIEIRAVMDELARITDDVMAGRGGLSVEALCERRLQYDAELSRLASEAIAAGPERPRWVGEAHAYSDVADELSVLAEDAEAAALAPRRWWISWYDAGSFELRSPWWITGYELTGAATICAAVIAPSEDAAQALVIAAHDTPPQSVRWRFVEEREADWEPFRDRFPRADWMVWPGVGSVSVDGEEEQ